MSLCIRSEIYPTPNVKINSDKKHSRAVSVKNSQQSTIVHISYDMAYGTEG